MNELESHGSLERELLGFGEHGVHADGAQLGAVDLRFMAEAEIARTSNGGLLLSNAAAA